MKEIMTPEEYVKSEMPKSGYYVTDHIRELMKAYAEYYHKEMVELLKQKLKSEYDDSEYDYNGELANEIGLSIDHYLTQTTNENK